MKTAKITKLVHIVARIQFKSDPRKVCYIVRSSNGADQYTTCLFDGKACSCTCPATKPCYHMTQIGAREAERSSAVVNARRARLEAEKELARISREATEMMARTDAARAAARTPAPRLQEDWSAPDNTSEVLSLTETAAASLRYSYGCHDEF